MPLDPTTRESLLAAIPEAAEQGRKAQEDWNAVSDSLCDENHEPLDERYDVRQHQRDAEAWAAFEPFLDHGPELLAQAETDFRTLHQSDGSPDLETIARRRHQLTELRHAVEGGRRERAAWEWVNEMILPGPEGDELRRRTEISRNAEGWHYAITFADHADVLVEIDQAIRHHSDSRDARTAQANAARTRSTNAPATTPPVEGPAPGTPSPPGRTHRTR
ncbi:hypothetical protein [Streptomyces sp. NPDC048172]|uniref:hypothetical protein n=1 Tax=Streptomyces sp. NPDC048172 TaxID=3365505 RepID=UPI003714F4AD